MEYRRTTDLKPHPLNRAIYSDSFDESLLSSIQEKGILTPLIVTDAKAEAGENVIVSGHRRWAAAIELGLAEVPITVSNLTRELDIEEAVILTNRQRDKTNEQKAREFTRLKEIEAERARERQVLGGQLTGKSHYVNQLVENFPQADSHNKSRDHAADPLGWSGRTAEKAARVVEAIDELDEAGDGETAGELRQTLNKSVSAAYEQARTIQAPPKPEPQPRAKDWFTIDEWNDLGHPDAELTFMSEPHMFVSMNGQPSMNRVNENIEWAAWSWNPITGCLHDCNYCYARDIANRFYPQAFKPSFIPSRLTAPQHTNQIAPRWGGDTGHTNVFVCSMADLFGKWVPARWIEAVLEVMWDNPQWQFLCLTKFPIRMAEFEYPPNTWLGTTVDRQWTVERAEKSFRKVRESGFGGISWLSCEPMLERLTFSSLEMFDWVVMGGASRSSQTAQHTPPFEDIIHLHLQAREANCMIYQKTNLIPGMSDEQRIREFPKAKY